MTKLNSMPVTPSVTSPDMIALTNEIEDLPALDLHALRSLWRQRLRTAPPPHLARGLLLRVLAYRLQAKILGDLDPQTVRYLDRIARERERRLVSGEKRQPKAPPPVPAIEARQRLKPGTLLIREYGGILNTVTVVEGGFAWRSTVYDSLSAVAFAITGTRWNGPRFFGLRDKVPSIQTLGIGSTSGTGVTAAVGAASVRAAARAEKTQGPLPTDRPLPQNNAIVAGETVTNRDVHGCSSVVGIEVLP